MASISIGASLSTAFAGVIATAFGGVAAYLALALAGLCGFLLLWFGMPETRPSSDDEAKGHIGGQEARA